MWGLFILISKQYVEPSPPLFIAKPTLHKLWHHPLYFSGWDDDLAGALPGSGRSPREEGETNSTISARKGLSLHPFLLTCLLHLYINHDTGAATF